MTFSTTIVTAFNQSLQAEWLSLWQRSLTQPFFLHPEFQRLWWLHEGRGELLIITVNNDDGGLVGLLPLFKDSDHLRITGATDLSDYLDILVDPTNQDLIYREILLGLSKIGNWKELRLENISQSSPTFTQLPVAARSIGWQLEQAQQNLCPVISLPPTQDEYFNLLKPDQQKKFKKLLKSIGEEDDITYRLIDKTEEMETAVTSFITLHKASSSDKAKFWTPQREAFFVEMATRLSQEGLVKLYFLDVNQDPAAALFIFDYQNQFLAYNSGFNAYRYGYMGVNNALTLHTIQDAIKLGRTRYDFMRGDESYKYQFGAQAEPVFGLVVQK
jgi:CelD/BcsL family acetyltransferase involved in cellulose biosynthesis